MTDQIVLALTTLTAVAIVALAALRGWHGWLALKERELDRPRQHQPDADSGSPLGAARIELSDLKERIRKLEAIAAGVDL